MRCGAYWPDNGKPKRTELGCDTASFEMTVNKNKYLHFRTGADGYYGTVYEYNKNAGIELSLSFDGSLFTFEEIEKDMDYLFTIKEVTKEFTEKEEQKEQEDIER